MDSQDVDPEVAPLQEPLERPERQPDRLFGPVQQVEVDVARPSVFPGTWVGVTRTGWSRGNPFRPGLSVRLGTPRLLGQTLLSLCLSCVRGPLDPVLTTIPGDGRGPRTASGVDVEPLEQPVETRVREREQLELDVEDVDAEVKEREHEAQGKRDVVVEVEQPVEGGEQEVSDETEELQTKVDRPFFRFCTHPRRTVFRPTR